jgi:hypothetical protein
MLPGPDYIIQCPLCNNKLIKRSLLSGNTIGEKLFSDGKRITPMLTEFPSLTKCDACNNIFWVHKAKEIEVFDYGCAVCEDGKKPDFVRFLDVKEYFDALSFQVFKTKAEELYIRRKIWWSFNDRGRIGEDLFKNNAEQELWHENHIHLIAVLNPEDVNQKIMIAELNRNLGFFEKCIDMINSIPDTDMDWLKAKFLKECELKNMKVFQLK